MKLIKLIFDHNKIYNTTKDGVVFILKETYKILGFIKIKIYRFPYSKEVEILVITSRFCKYIKIT